MSDEQRKLVFRLCFDLGCTKETVRDRALKALGCERLEWATRPMASAAIDALRYELEERRGLQTSDRANGEARHA